MKYTYAQRNEFVAGAIRYALPSDRSQSQIDALLDEWTTQAIEHGSQLVKDTHAAYLTQSDSDVARRHYCRVLKLVECGA